MSVYTNTFLLTCFCQWGESFTVVGLHLASHFITQFSLMITAFISSLLYLLLVSTVLLLRKSFLTSLHTFIIPGFLLCLLVLMSFLTSVNWSVPTSSWHLWVTDDYHVSPFSFVQGKQIEAFHPLYITHLTAFWHHTCCTPDLQKLFSSSEVTKLLKETPAWVEYKSSIFS